jgi:uncharacterized membrane protein
MKRPVIFPPFRMGRGGAFSTILFFSFFYIILIAGTTSFTKLGFSQFVAEAIILGTLAGSLFNIPLAKLEPEEHVEEICLPPYSFPVHVIEKEGRATILAVNVGGCLIPIIVCIYLLSKVPKALPSALITLVAVTVIMYKISRPVEGVGIVAPGFIPAIAAALIALLLDPEMAPVIAYVGGTLGTLFGADLLNLSTIRNLKATFASIGGAGTFDGIFLVGILAVLLV